MSDSSGVVQEVFPLIWSDDVERLLDWAISSLGLTESWRAPGDQSLEHAEVLWPGGRVSINIRTESTRNMGPSGISLRVDDRAEVDAVHARALAAWADILMGPMDSRVAYSFTAVDPDGNQWWVNAETGFLDELRGEAADG
jgi:uncharacterized glyoxalase superfamily protein PhnB